MNTEAKNISQALIGTIMVLTSYPLLIMGLFALGPFFKFEGVALVVGGIVMHLGGSLIGEQQRNKLSKKELVTHLVKRTLLIVLILLAVHLISFRQIY